MRRFLVPALLVNLAGLPALAQSAPEPGSQNVRASNAPGIAMPNQAYTGWQRPAPQPIADAQSYTPPPNWGDRDNRQRESARGWDQNDGRYRRHDDRDDRNWREDRNWRDRDGHDRWSRDWRQDRRYDWRRYRDMHRPQYRKPHYPRPYGYSYGYRRLVIGLYLDRVFYAPGYWINDPWSYRLPRTYGSLRWVRYYDDVVLIDLRNGRIVDVIYDFFW